VRRVAATIAAGCLLASGVLAPAIAAAASRPTLTQMQSYFMCVVCKEPLAVAQSPEAARERALITTLISQGQSKQQIINAMEAQYGTAVLAQPPAHGFNLTIYILPPAVLVLGVALLVFTIPRWKRAQQARAAAADARPKPQIEPAEAMRLEQDIARFD
jgi:cytochrome c-type biogenesis protein CcmH